MWGALAAAVVLGSSSAPAAQPSRIVFASSRTTVSQLYSVEPSGRELAQLTFGAGDWLAPLSSPDGRFVAAFRGNELWLMRGDGRDARLLAQAGKAIFDSPSWSRDSRRLAFAKDGAIWTIAAARGPPRQVTHGVGDSEPTFSPDGRSIAFLRPDSYGDGDMLVVPATRSREGRHPRGVGQACLVAGREVDRGHRRKVFDHRPRPAEQRRAQGRRQRLRLCPYWGRVVAR